MMAALELTLVISEELFSTDLVKDLEKDLVHRLG
jgi:hypothetical protein